MAEQSRQDPLEQVAASLADAVQVTFELWDDVQGDQRVRGVVFFARHCLGELELGDRQAASEALSKMDDARSLI